MKKKPTNRTAKNNNPNNSKDKRTQKTVPPQKTRENKATAAKSAAAETAETTKPTDMTKHADGFPKRLPFWAKLRFNKPRPTLVIDRAQAWDKQKKKMTDGFVHREVTHTPKDGEHEKIKPNPKPGDEDPMYLKRPRKLPKQLFGPHGDNWDMPKKLKERYDKNNDKNEGNDDKSK